MILVCHVTEEESHLVSYLVRPHTKRSEALKLEELFVQLEASLQLSYLSETVFKAIYRTLFRHQASSNDR
jgi:hypothetical protein